MPRHTFTRRLRSRLTLVPRYTLDQPTPVNLTACIWLYMLSSNFRAPSTLFNLTQDAGWKLNGSSFFSPCVNCFAFSSHAEDFCGWRWSVGRGNISVMKSSSILRQYCSTALLIVCIYDTQSIGCPFQSRSTKPTLARLVKNRACWYSSNHSKSCKNVIGLRKESKRSTIEELNPSSFPSRSNLSGKFKLCYLSYSVD